MESRYTYPDSDPYVHYYSYFEEYSNKENFDLYYKNFAWDEELGIIGRLGVRNSHLIKQCRGERDTKADFNVTRRLFRDRLQGDVLAHQGIVPLHHHLHRRKVAGRSPASRGITRPNRAAVYKYGVFCIFSPNP